MPWFEEYTASSQRENVHMRKYWLKLNISDERANRMPPTALWAVSVTKSHNIGTILSLISWFRNSLGEKWALIVSELVSQREQQLRYFSSTRLKVKVCPSICTSIWSHVHLQAICSSAKYICSHGHSPALSTHALPQLPAQSPANTIFQLCTERVKSRERH